jgi:hypothetical protein
MRVLRIVPPYGGTRHAVASPGRSIEGRSSEGSGQRGTPATPIFPRAAPQGPAQPPQGKHPLTPREMSRSLGSLRPAPLHTVGRNRGSIAGPGSDVFPAVGGPPPKVLRVAWPCSAAIDGRRKSLRSAHGSRGCRETHSPQPPGKALAENLSSHPSPAVTARPNTRTPRHRSLPTLMRRSRFVGQRVGRFARRRKGMEQRMRQPQGVLPGRISATCFVKRTYG